MEYEHVIFERRGAVGVLTLNRPERRNAYSIQTVDEVHRVCDELDADLTTRVLILTGAGPAFCAGLDLKGGGLDAWPEKELGLVQRQYRLQRRLASMVLRLRDIPQPVIAAIHGPAVGGGLALIAASDLRIADTTARFNAAFIKLGLSGGDDGSSWFLPRLVGPAKAAEILYTGRFVGAAEALSIGLVNEVVEDGEHVRAAEKMAEQILSNSPLGIRMTKELLNYSLDAPGLRQAMELEHRTQVLCMMTDDFAEGVRAFGERRPARYTDR
jgi:enoyl-CoA hydratase